MRTECNEYTDLTFILPWTVYTCLCVVYVVLTRERMKSIQKKVEGCGGGIKREEKITVQTYHTFRRQQVSIFIWLWLWLGLLLRLWCWCFRWRSRLFLAPLLSFSWWLARFTATNTSCISALFFFAIFSTLFSCLLFSRFRLRWLLFFLFSWFGGLILLLFFFFFIAWFVRLF